MDNDKNSAPGGRPQPLARDILAHIRMGARGLILSRAESFGGGPAIRFWLDPGPGRAPSPLVFAGNGSTRRLVAALHEALATTFGEPWAGHRAPLAQAEIDGLHSAVESGSRTITTSVARTPDGRPALVIGIRANGARMGEITLTTGPAVCFLGSLLGAFKSAFGRDFEQSPPQKSRDGSTVVPVRSRVACAVRPHGVPLGKVAP